MNFYLIIFKKNIFLQPLEIFLLVQVCPGTTEVEGEVFFSQNFRAAQNCQIGQIQLRWNCKDPPRFLGEKGNSKGREGKDYTEIYICNKISLRANIGQVLEIVKGSNQNCKQKESQKSSK